ncbi:MAG: cell division protein [Pyrinomonadaceae bacterium]
MPRVVLEKQINAPAEVCFDLVRDIRVHTQTTMQTGEKAVDGVTNGMIALGQTVTFEGSHFGIRQRLTVQVTQFERPSVFVDEMTHGIFKTFKHIHEFIVRDEGTLMRDTVIWTSPAGFLGRIADRLFLERHLTELVRTRNGMLKILAEAHPAQP